MTAELIGIIAAAIALGALTSTLAGFMFVSLSRMEGRLNQRIGGVENRMDEQKADLISRMDEQKSDLINRMDELKSDLVKQVDDLKHDHGRRLDSIESRLQAVEQGQAEVKGSVETLQRVVIATLQREIEAEREPVGTE